MKCRVMTDSVCDSNLPALHYSGHYSYSLLSEGWPHHCMIIGVFPRECTILDGVLLVNILNIQNYIVAL